MFLGASARRGRDRPDRLRESPPSRSSWPCAFDGEIVNADSMQIFRFMDIGTAKPSLEERARVPHHLYDIANPDEAYSAGPLRQRMRRAAAAAIHARDRVVFLTGGTGLYIRAFLDGLVPRQGRQTVPCASASKPNTSRAAEEGDPARLHRRLLGPRPRGRRARFIPMMSAAPSGPSRFSSNRGRSASSVRAAHAFTDRPFRVLHLAIDPGREVVGRTDRRDVPRE